MPSVFPAVSLCSSRTGECLLLDIEFVKILSWSSLPTPPCQDLLGYCGDSHPWKLGRPGAADVPHVLILNSWLDGVNILSCVADPIAFISTILTVFSSLPPSLLSATGAYIRVDH